MELTQTVIAVATEALLAATVIRSLCVDAVRVLVTQMLVRGTLVNLHAIVFI